MNCANCGLPISENMEPGRYGNTRCHKNNHCMYATCHYANDHNDWKNTKWCDKQGRPYVASTKRGDVAIMNLQEFKFVLPKEEPELNDINLAVWDKI